MYAVGSQQWLVLLARTVGVDKLIRTGLQGENLHHNEVGTRPRARARSGSKQGGTALT